MWRTNRGGQFLLSLLSGVSRTDRGVIFAAVTLLTPLGDVRMFTGCMVWM